MIVPEVSVQTCALGSLLKELFPPLPPASIPVSPQHPLFLQKLGKEVGPGAVLPAGVQIRGRRS